MRVVIDVTEARFLHIIAPSKPDQCLEGDATVSRTYSALTLRQLQRLYENTTGFALTTSDYNATLQACKFLAIKLLTLERSYVYALEKEDGQEADG